MNILLKLSNKDFKIKISGNVIRLHCLCTNICPEKCILGQIPIYCQEICSEQLKILPNQLQHQVFGKLIVKLQQNIAKFEQNIFVKKFLICHYFVLRPQTGFIKAYCQYLLGKISKTANIQPFSKMAVTFEPLMGF